VSAFETVDAGPISNERRRSINQRIRDITLMSVETAKEMDAAVVQVSKPV